MTSASRGEENAEGTDPAAVDPPPAQGTAGGISIGVLTGGAVAAGASARAEDRSYRTDGPVEPPAGHWPPVPLPAAPGGISVSVMTGGAAASGPGAQALDNSVQAIEAPSELLAAVRVLRGQLLLAGPGEETSALGAQLDEAEEEITTTGLVRRDRLQRLRERLELGASTVAGLSSAAALVQQIAQLSGLG
ncbi:hypothetical protein ACFWIQ_33510 [Kitasatospora sp. NPDC127059]|uniref:hypothetical protein n=1 Tax=unclassified Kitasatospora TaxID=2633591 RepID=UPI00365C379C